jgi:hypothetical protein
MNADDRACLFPPTEEEQMAGRFFRDNFYVTRDKTAEAIEESGMMVHIELDQFKENHGTETGSLYIMKFSKQLQNFPSPLLMECW